MEDFRLWAKIIINSSLFTLHSSFFTPVPKGNGNTPLFPLPFSYSTARISSIIYKGRFNSQSSRLKSAMDVRTERSGKNFSR